MAGMETAPRRHWFQYSLKGLLVLTLMVASYFAGVATMRDRVRLAEEDTNYWKGHAKEINAHFRRVWLELMTWKKRHGYPPGADPEDYLPENAADR